MYNTWRSHTDYEKTMTNHDWLVEQTIQVIMLIDEKTGGDMDIRELKYLSIDTDDICPKDWYIPSTTEANETIVAEGINDKDTALNSPLKIGLAGSRKCNRCCLIFRKRE